jgi:ribonuclease BN (tRNA processing enzyme)
VRYGGNTSCASLSADGHPPIILDMGTGLRAFGEELARGGVPCGVTCDMQTTGQVPVTDPAFIGFLLLTHLHWDHIQGLPFFGPLGDPESMLYVYGPRQEAGPLDEVFTGVMQPPYFPITPAMLAGNVRFCGAGNDDFPVGGAKVRSRWVRHTSPTLGYRVETEGISVAYLSDHGPGCSDDADDFVPADVLDLCDGVDVLIHDSQHTHSEYQTKKNWGHCTVDYAVHVARESGAQRLALFHHCPTHSDDDVDRILRYCQDLTDRIGGPEVFAAADGLTVELRSGITA